MIDWTLFWLSLKYQIILKHLTPKHLANFWKFSSKSPYVHFFRKFWKNHFLRVMKDFRVFVEKPIGKSLTLFYVFSATRWGGGVTLNYGKNGWKKWNFDLSTIVKMNEKIPKKFRFSPCIMSISKKVLIISVVSRNCIFWKQKFKFLHIGILNIIFSQILEKQNFFTNLKYGNFIDFFEKKVKKTRILNLLIHCNFNIFFEKKKRKMIFFLLSWYLYIRGFRLHLNTKKQRNEFFELLKSVTCSRFH